MAKKIQKINQNYKQKWMRDKDLAKTIFLLFLSVIGISIILLYILAKVNPKGYILMFYPFVYIFNLYQSASPGEKLSVIFLLIGGLGGWFLKKWTKKRE